MFGETTKEDKKKWFESLSLISSEEESDYDDDPVSNSCLFIEVPNANLRFPYPIFSDDSDEESKNIKLSRVAKRSRTLDCHSDKSQPSRNKQKKVRDELKRVWNYTKRKKKQLVFCRQGTVLSTTDDETEPKKKRHKKPHRRKRTKLKLSSSEENLDKNMVVPKSEFEENSYIGRSFSKFIDSSSNSETSECNENKLTTVKKRSLYNFFHNLSSSHNSCSDSESARSPTLNRAMDSELRKAGDKKRADHSISSSEEETKQLVTFTHKTKNKNGPSAKKITHLPSKHPFKNLITAQQLQEDNRKMKKGLKPISISKKVDKHIETSHEEIQKLNQPSKKVDYSLKKKKADLQLRTNSSKIRRSQNSKLQNLKKRFISSNKSCVELSKKLRCNANLNTTDKMLSNSHTTRHKTKPTQRLSEDQTKEARSNSKSKETARSFSNNGQEIKQNEAKYTVNVNVYCSSNESNASRSVQEGQEDHSSNKSIGKESSRDLDINLSVIQEEEATKSTHKKVRISHTNQSKNKLDNKPPILCESNSESKLNKYSLLNRGCQSIITSNENKPGQFDLVGNIISQMKVNPYPCHKSRRKSLEQGTDAMGWFSNLSPSLPNTQALPIMSNTVSGASKGPAQHSLTPPSASSKLSLTTPLYQQLLNPHQTLSENQDNAISKRSLYTKNNNENNVSLSTKTDKGTHYVSTIDIASKHCSNEVIIPFYSANHNDYITRPENPQTNIDKSGLESENMEHFQLCSDDTSSVQSHLEGNHNLKNSSEPKCQFNNSSINSKKPISDSPGVRKTSKVSFMHRKSESGLTVNNINNTQTSGPSNLAKTYHAQRNIGKNSASTNSKSLTQTVPIKLRHCSNNDSLKKSTTSENANPQNHANVLDCEQSASKKGVRIRIQGNEFLYQKNKNSDDLSLNSRSKTLTTNKPVSLSNLMDENDLSHYDHQDRFPLSVENYQAERENLTPESSGAAIIGNNEIQNSSSRSKEIENSSGDSNEDSSSSDDSSSSSSSSDSKQNTGESDSSSSSSKLNITEQEEVIDHTAQASSRAQQEITNVDVEVITLDSSSDEELLMSNNVPMDDIVSVERPDGLTVQKEVDCVPPESNSTNSGQVKSIFDPVEDCELLTREMEIDVERKTHDASIPPFGKNCLNVTTNDNCVPSSSNSFVGKIRVKSLTELGVDSQITHPENALTNISEQNNAVQLQTNILPSTNKKTKVEEQGIDGDISKIREPLRIKLSKVPPVYKRSLYKVQSTIHIPKNVGVSQTNILKPQEKGNTTNNLDNTINSNQSQSEENASKLPSSLNVSSEPKSLQNPILTAKNVMETHGNILHNPPVSKTQSSGNVLCVQRGEPTTHKCVQQEANQSKTYELSNLVSNMSTIPQNSQIKKPIPNLVALVSTPVFLTTVYSKVQAKNQMQPMAIMQPHLVPFTDNNGKRSALSLGDGQNSSAYHGVAVISQTQGRSPDDIAASSTVGTVPITHSKQTLDKCKSLKTNPHSNNNPVDKKTEELFFKLCDELLTEVVCLKIPRMVDDLHLIILQDKFKEERLKNTEQLLSPETVQSEKNGAERDFNDQIRKRAHSFVPLFTTVVNKIKKSNLRSLVIALYIRFINQLQTIDPKYAKYRLTLRHIIKAMLQKSGSTSNDICQIFSDNDSSFQQNYLFIEPLLKKYDLYVDQRRVQKQINNYQVGLTKRHINKITEVPSIQQSTDKNIQQEEKSTGKILNTYTTVNGSFSCSTPYQANQNPQQIASPLPINVTNPVQIEPTSSNSSESTQQINLDDIMFEAFFKTITPNLELNPPNLTRAPSEEGHS